MMAGYKYRPFAFYISVFLMTWAFWIPAIFIQNESALILMIIGLLMPATLAIIFVFLSGNKALKTDFRRKIVRFYRLKPISIILAIIAFFLIAAISIVASVISIGQEWSQFSFTEFSFSIQGSSALLTIILASIIEEIGWRGYGEDSIASTCSWFKESMIFGTIWALWHIPLFFMDGTYQKTLLDLGPLYVVNFLVSCIALGFFTTIVYLKNNRSMIACIIFHFFVNFIQEKIALTPETKCLETLFISLGAIMIVLTNKDIFFNRDHIGNMLEKNYS